MALVGTVGSSSGGKGRERGRELPVSVNALVAREQAIVPRAGSHNASHRCLCLDRFHPTAPQPHPALLPALPAPESPKSFSVGVNRMSTTTTRIAQMGQGWLDERPDVCAAHKQNTWLGYSKSAQCLFSFRRGKRGSVVQPRLLVLRSERHMALFSASFSLARSNTLHRMRRECHVPHRLKGT